jgi:hypothetical protein
MGRLGKVVRWWLKGWNEFAAVAGGRAQDLVGARPWDGR